MAGIRQTIVIMLCLFGFSKGNARAQSGNFFAEKPKGFYGGLIAGANISTVNGDSYGGYHKLGFNAGGIVYMQFAQQFGASISLIYSQRGSRGVRMAYSVYIDTFIEKYYLDLNYAELPVLFHYFGHPKLHVGAGVSYARLLSSKEELLTDQPVYIDPKLYVFNKEDLNGVLQASWQLGKNLFIDGRYQFSLKPVRDWDKIHVKAGYGSRGQYNNLFSFRLLFLVK